jgi:hypothetical protein
MNFRVLATSAALLSAAGIAGCGGSSNNTASNGSSTNAPTLLAATFSPNHAQVTSADVSISLKGNVTGSAPSGSGDFEGSIAYNKAKSGDVPDFAALAKVNLSSSKGSKTNIQAGATYVGGRLYVAYQPNGSSTLTNYDAGSEISKRITDSLQQAEKNATAGATTPATTTLKKFGLDPSTWLKNPTVAGTESVGGVDTYKITGAVDLTAMVPNLLQAAKTAQTLTGDSTKVPTVTPDEIKKVSDQVKTLNVTVWTGKDDNIMRQVEVDLDWKGEKGQAASGQLKITFNKVNQQQDISAPSDTQPITDLLTQLGPLLQQLQGGGLSALSGGSGAGSSSGSTSSATSPSSAATQAYAKCLSAAGSSTSAQNQCNALIGTSQ